MENFNCDEKEDLSNKPYTVGQAKEEFSDPILIHSAITDLKGTPDKNTNVDITYGNVRICNGNLLVRPGITTVQELQCERELYVCKRSDLIDDVYHHSKTYCTDKVYCEEEVLGETHSKWKGICYADAFISGYGGGNGNAEIMGTLEVHQSTQLNSTLDVVSNITAPTFNGNVNGSCSGNKGFDIPHPNDSNKRIRHICVEGPAADIYIRGKLDGTHIIELPGYWKGLVDYDTITVNLTPIGRPDLSLHVKDITEDKITLSSDHLVQVKCFYEVWVSRWIDPNNHDEKLVTEYEGTIEDYPGDNTKYSLAGYHYDKRAIDRVWWQ